MRLFLEIAVPDSIRQQAVLLAERFRPFVEGTFVKKENMHLSLKFLGEVPDKKLPSLQAALSKASIPPFELEVSGVGTFPTLNDIHVLWFGAVKGARDFVELQKKIDLELAPLKFPPEKSYVPHLTFARVKRVLDKAKLRELVEHNHNTYNLGSFAVSGFKLMKSTLTPNGPQYECLSDFSLSDGTGA